MSFDLDDFVRVHEHDSDRALLLASLAEMESGTSGLSSLEIHAPLEVMARYLLLPLVDSRRREGARRYLAAAARDFADVAVPAIRQADDPTNRVGGNDLAAASWPVIGCCLAATMCQPESRLNRQALATRVLQQVGGAGHGQILLGHMLNADLDVRRKLLPHMQMFIRAYREDPSTEKGAVIPQLGPLLRASPAAFDEFLSGVPRSSVDTPHTGIRGVMARGQGVEVAEIDSVDGSTPFGAAGTACVAAARMMLTAETDMEYGWSHCLTLSEAAWGFVDRGDDTGAIVALSYVTGFVSALGFPGWPSPVPHRLNASRGIAALRQALASASPEDAVAICLGASEDIAMQAWGEVVSQASDMKDAHLVKYVHAALRCATRKPEAEPVFLAAATRLLARWLAR